VLPEEHFDQLKHPNMELSDAGQINIFQARMAQNNKGCSYYFVKLDEDILRPLLIYKYDEEEMWYQDEQVELM
jgi:hypothetical protein